MRKLLSIFSMLALMWLFFCGIHMLDNAWNMHTMEETYGDTLCDWNIVGTSCIGPGEAYSMSLILIMGSIWFITAITMINTLAPPDEGDSK